MAPKSQKTNKKNGKRVPVIPCGVAIIRRGREFLIAQRNPEDTLGSCWEFPGGKRNRGESFEACVVREVREELGVEVHVHEKLMDIRKKYNGRIIWLNFYLCSHVSGDPQPLDCQKVQWADLRELKSFNFPPANGPVIESLLKQFSSHP